MGLQGQINAIAAQQGATSTERDLLTSPVVYTDDASSTNACERVELESGTIAFHKTFAGVHVRLADDYGHDDPDQIPVQEAAAWRLAAALGAPLNQIVCVCVLRTLDDEPGSLSLMVPGSPWPADSDDAFNALAGQATAAAFFDSLIAQQDRHLGNLHLDGSRRALGLFDHGYAFALPGDYLNSAQIVQWRHTNGDPTLTSWERAALARLLANDDLLGLRPILTSPRADALADRAQRMHTTNQILRVGAF